MHFEPSVGSCETHLSRLFFTNDRVYKLLKPVAFPFVDFSSTERRCAAAKTEYDVNHDIAPDVYLGLADVIEQGELVDRMIVMRRLRAEDELTHVLGRSDRDENIRAVARHAAALHSRRPTIRGDAARPASPEAIAKNWADNFAAIRPFVGSVINPHQFDEAQELSERFLAGRRDLFRWRIDAGWVRDCHGDLRCEHVFCTDDGPRLIDCVAFDESLRIGDALGDIAFLAMDLHRLVDARAAVTLMKAWNEFTNEHHPSSLAHFYVAYRAHVRCKIACLKVAAGVDDAAQEAREYHRLAVEHLGHSRVRMVLVGGGPGTGKSTVAEGIARQFGAVWLRADEVRKDIAGIRHDEHAFAAPGEGIYTPEVNAKVTAELVRQADVMLRHGISVVIDATWSSAADRVKLRKVAVASAASIGELKCELPDGIARERIARRMASIHNPSDATPELVDFVAARFDTWPEALPISTQRSIKATVAAACLAVSGRTEGEPIEERFVLDEAVLRHMANAWLLAHTKV